MKRKLAFFIPLVAMGLFITSCNEEPFNISITGTSIETLDPEFIAGKTYYGVDIQEKDFQKYEELKEAVGTQIYSFNNEGEFLYYSTKSYNMGVVEENFTCWKGQYETTTSYDLYVNGYKSNGEWVLLPIADQIPRRFTINGDYLSLEYLAEIEEGDSAIVHLLFKENTYTGTVKGHRAYFENVEIEVITGVSQEDADGIIEDAKNTYYSTTMSFEEDGTLYLILTDDYYIVGTYSQVGNTLTVQLTSLYNHGQVSDMSTVPYEPLFHDDFLRFPLGGGGASDFSYSLYGIYTII